MYAHFYHLKKEPFHVTPDPEFFYLSPTHKEALASIIYGVTAGKGFIVITGEVGVGKTTVLRSYLERTNGKKSRVVYVFNPNISFKELLQYIFQELNVDPKTGDVNQMVTRLQHLMIDERQEGRNIVLLIDEAHNMPVETLENLRMLSNLETSRDKLMQIVLVGQPEFEEMLNRKELRQLKQRIAVHAIITPFNRKESFAYIQHRLTKAGMNHTPVFTRMALRKIVKRAGGIPRVINILCDNALIAGVGYRKRPVNSTIVDHAIVDYDGRKPSSLKWWMSVSGTAIVGAVCVFLLSPYSETLRSTVGNNYRRILGVTPSGVVVSVNTQKNSSLTVVPPTAKAKAPEPLATAPEQATETELESISPPSAIEGRLSTPRPDPSTMVRTTSPGLSSTLAQPEGIEVQPESRLATSPSKAGVRPSERVAEAPETSFPVVRVIKQGQTLFRLTKEVYGHADPRLVEWVKENNPSISDITRIPAGTKIVFPKEPEEGQVKVQVKVKEIKKNTPQPQPQP